MITPQSLPTLRIEEMKVVEAQATKLGFNWAPLPLDHPRNVLKQSDCEQFESRLGNFSKIMYEAEVGVNDSPVGVNDTPVFLLNEYIVELNPANFNILNQILN